MRIMVPQAPQGPPETGLPKKLGTEVSQLQWPYLGPTLVVVVWLLSFPLCIIKFGISDFPPGGPAEAVSPAEYISDMSVS